MSAEPQLVTVPADLLRELLLGPPKPEITDPSLDKDGWPKRWSDPTYLGDGPWAA